MKRLLGALALVLACAHSAVADETPSVAFMLTHRFGVAQAKAVKIADAVTAAAYRYSLSPTLLLAIITIESRFDEKAIGPRGATGLMQVVPAVHKLRLVGKDLRDPADNIDVGSSILRTYVKLHGGDVHAALKNYGGSDTYARNVGVLARKFAVRLGLRDAAPDVAPDAAPATP